MIKSGDLLRARSKVFQNEPGRFAHFAHGGKRESSQFGVIITTRSDTLSVLMEAVRWASETRGRRPCARRRQGKKRRGLCNYANLIRPWNVLVALYHTTSRGERGNAGLVAKS